MPIPKQDQDRIQMANDVRAVFVTGEKSLDDFDKAYADVLKDAYRFSAWRYTSDKPSIAPRTRETLDLV
jgi:hypothetical protein